MTELIDNSEQFCRIEKKISNGIRIFLIDCSDTEIINILIASIKNKSLNDVEIWHSIGAIQQDDTLLCISKEEMSEIIKMYQMYDFSDKVFVISDGNLCGSMFNYFENGILTKLELVDALLYSM